MTKQLYRVYLFTRSKYTTEEVFATQMNPRLCKLRVEAIHGKSRKFATLPVTFIGDEFPRLFNSDGTLKNPKKPTLCDEAASRQTALAYSTACSLVEKLIKQGKFETTTSLQFDQELNEAFRKVKGHDEYYWHRQVQEERDSK